MQNAEREGRRVIQRGAIPLVPHMAFGPYFGLLDEERAMEVCLRMVEECDALMLPAGRLTSMTEGMEDEVAHARSLELPILRQSELARFVEQWREDYAALQEVTNA